MNDSSRAASRTVRANGPTWSSDDANAMSPYRDTAPYVGFIPTIPQRAAGWRMDPPVSVPSDQGAWHAATAAAEPPLEPPGTRSGSHGLRVSWNAEFSVLDPIANSSMFVLPITTAPAASRRATQVAVYTGVKPSRMREPAVVTRPRVESTSLIATGTPRSGGLSSIASISRARARARSPSSARYEPHRSSAARARYASVSSSAVVSPAASDSSASSAVSDLGSIIRCVAPRTRRRRPRGPREAPRQP